MGFETVAIARGADKADDAKRAWRTPLHRLDGRGRRRRVAGPGRRGGGARDGRELSGDGQTVGGLGPEGELVIVGVTFDPLPITPGDLDHRRPAVSGHPSGTSRDVEETMHFAVQSGVRARIEERPLAAGRGGVRGDGRGARALPHGA